MTNVPEIRFKGFTDAWVQRKLGEAIKVNSGKDYKHLNDGDIPVYGTGGYMLSVDDSLSDIDAIGIGRKGTIDKPQLLSAPFWTVDTLFFMTPLCDNDLLFLYALSQKIEWAKMDESTGVPSLSKVNIEKVDTCVPEYHEQTAIGCFFRTLDTTITLHKRKLDRLKELKMAYLQQMFPQSGESVPRLRFAGFVGDWEVCKLGNIAEFNPRSVVPNSFEYVDLESVVGTSLISYRTENKETAPSRAQRLAKKGDVFFQTVRPYQMNNYLFELPFDNFVFSTGYAQLRPQIDSYFLLCKLQEKNFVTKVLDRCTGTSYPAINSTDLAEIDIGIAYDEAEQIAVGSFFRNLDKQITTQQAKLDRLKQLKQAYLQKMFV